MNIGEMGTATCLFMKEGDILMSEEVIRNFTGQILGRLEDQGDKIVARDF